MTITFLQPDGVPITAQQERQGSAALHGAGANRPLGGRSGFRVDTPANVLTVTTTTWTLLPCSAMIDPGATTHQGMYGWASDANITGTPTPPDATLPRKDIYYIQVNDSTSGDGSGAVNANVYYLAGTPNATPTAPTLPPRSLLIGTATVPQNGGGAPAVVLNPARFVAAGGILPVYSLAERDALTGHAGLTVRRMDILGHPLEEHTGSAWLGTSHQHWTTSASGLAASTVYNLGTYAEGGTTTDAAFVTNSGGAFNFAGPGTYNVLITQKWSTAAAGRAFISLENTSGTATMGGIYGRASFASGEDTTTLSVTFRTAAAITLYPKLFQSTGVVNVEGSVRITRIGS